eukprot:scaffold11481_cov18-Tisochrysis_lutea.AAC.2
MRTAKHSGPHQEDALAQPFIGQTGRGEIPGHPNMSKRDKKTSTTVTGQVNQGKTRGKKKSA